MNSTDNKSSDRSRRAFLKKSSIASLGLLIIRPSLFSSSFLQAPRPNSKISGVQIGVITYSFRDLPGSAEETLKYILESGMSGIELMGDPAEEYAGRPANPVKMKPWVDGHPPQYSDEEKAQFAEHRKAVAAWRSTVSMDKFVEFRKMYNRAGVEIYAFKPDALGTNNTDAEIEYALKAAKALGAKSVTVEIQDAAQSKRLGEFGAKHKIYIGYHAHTQATDTAWDVALDQSPYNSMNLDCGHYIAAGGSNTKETLLALIEAKHDRITTMHLKDRKSKEHGGENTPWGEGDTPIIEILTLLKTKKYAIPGTIELEYDIPAGSSSIKETYRCLEYARKALGA